ncbi:MAG: hypothetical protein IVW55_05890 [Chloroflexi bacterium]|nr:hypothetical protein [Chloroflexota bacterium]
MQANPVIVKELRGRMRGWRAAVVLTIYLVVLSGVSLLIYNVARSFGTGYNSSVQASQVGKILFSGLVIFQTIMVALLTPAFTASSITSEREQKTYDLLVTTLLPPRSIILGKLGSALSYVALLILAVAPIESLAFIFGGVSPEEVIISQVVMLMSALLYACIGIFWSSLLRSSVASNVLTYGTILIQMIGVPFLYYFVALGMGAFGLGAGGQSPSDTVSFVYATGIILSLNPLAAMIISEVFVLRGDPLFVYTSTQVLSGHDIFVVSPWLIFCAEALIISLVLVLASMRLVRPVRGHRRVAATVAPDAQAIPPGSV